MLENPKILAGKKPIFENLVRYGFEYENDVYSFSKNIMDNMFRFNIYITKTGITKLIVIDKESNDEYALIFNPNATGSFVGKVRAECEEIFNDILKKCYEPDIYKTKNAKLFITYIREKYNIEAEFLWEKLPNHAIFRKSDTKKWFATIATVKKRTIGIPHDGTIEIIGLRGSEELVSELVDGKNIFPGYHMNKKYWYTIPLDARVPIEDIYRYADNSFNTLLK